MTITPVAKSVKKRAATAGGEGFGFVLGGG
jgi:hypothetical protein